LRRAALPQVQPGQANIQQIYNDLIIKRNFNIVQSKKQEIFIEPYYCVPEKMSPGVYRGGPLQQGKKQKKPYGSEP
jgi:hypothetical protein